MSRDTPLNDDYTAYRVAALPRDEGEFQLTQLFERGYDRWTVDGTQQTEKLLADVERFTCDAFTPSTREKAAERPYVDDPGMLAVLTTLGAVCIMDHPKLEDTPPRRLALLGDLRELYVNNIASLVREYEDWSLHQGIAEALYAKKPVRTASTQDVSVRISRPSLSLVRGTISRFHSSLPHENVSLVQMAMRVNRARFKHTSRTTISTSPSRIL